MSKQGYMGRPDIKGLLGQTLDEEEKADQRLSELAKSGINQKAQQKTEQEFAA
jgi:ferritin-like metal-binding protein YciE